MLLVIDNYDSFTYNLVQVLDDLVDQVIVSYNDGVTTEEIRRLNPDAIVISPGPGTPQCAGISTQLVREFGNSIPILGVCLGHQCIGAAFGAIVIPTEPVHGKISKIRHDGSRVFSAVPNPVEVVRYHSLTIDPATLPAEFEVTAETADGIIMGMQHKELPLTGVQFHPEAILTQYGNKMLENWVQGWQK